MTQSTRPKITLEQGEAAVELLFRLRRHGLRAAWELKESERSIAQEAFDLLDAIFGPDFDFHGPIKSHEADLRVGL